MPLSQDVDLTRYNGQEYGSDVSAAPSSKEGTAISFTTGPRGTETHWRQVAFLLRSPIELKLGESGGA